MIIQCTIIVIRVGDPKPVKSFPTSMDSVLVNYDGQTIVYKDSLSSSFDKRDNFWLVLSSVITWLVRRFSALFKGGENITNNGPIIFQILWKRNLIYTFWFSL